MSGVLPETERERQVRQLAGRLLTWPDPEGPVSVDVIPVGYPDDFPTELVDRTELRFLGSAVRRRAGSLVGVEMVFEGPGEPEAVLADYESILIGLGWERADQLRPMSGGFEGHGLGEMSSLVDERKMAMIFLQAMDRVDGGTDLRVRYEVEQAQEMLANARHHRLPPEASMPPRLKPPPGVKLNAQGSGGGGGSWKSDARAQTEMAPVQLEAYFAKQLEAAGWGRVTGSADETFAWSSWLIPDHGQWRGTLVIVAAFPGERRLSLWAEETRRS